MTIKLKTNYLIVIFIVFTQHLISQNAWVPQHANIEISYSTPWEKISQGYDTPKGTLAGFMDQSDKSSVIVKTVKDVSKEMLSDYKYYQSIRQQMLKVNSANKLLDEDEEVIDSQTFHVMTFQMQTKFGIFIQKLYTLRNGVKILTIQIGYPKSLVSDVKLKPKKVNQFIQGIILKN